MENLKTKLMALTVAIIVVVIVLGLNISKPIGEDKLSGADATFHTGDKNISADLEIADTSEQRRTGLMNRTNLGENKGMLFIFSDQKNRSFWMKNTLIPLDIIYIDREKTIVDIDHAVPELNTTEDNLTLYPSDQPSKYVIEMNQGFTEKNSIEEGDKVEWIVWEK